MFAVFEEYLPEWMVNDRWQLAGLTLSQWIGLLLAAIVAFVVGLVLQQIIVNVGRIVARRTEVQWDNELFDALPGPLRLLLTLVVFSWMLPGVAPAAEAFLDPLLACGTIFAVTWFILRGLRIGGRLVEQYFTKGVENTVHARAIHTQVSVVRTILRFIILIGAVAMALMQFEVARTLGVSLLASAGVAAAALGFAARNTVASLLAGIQIAFTQTVKIGDVVVIEGEWGRIEDIRLTYVVVQIWDLRRLIVPVTYFTEKPIENWTTKATDLLGTVYLYTDYTVSVDDVRQELKRILNETELWDGKTQSVIVTNLTQNGAELRILVSAADSSKLWDLRCLVREKMLHWLQTRGEKVLPKHRVVTEPTGDSGAAAESAAASD